MNFTIVNAMLLFEVETARDIPALFSRKLLTFFLYILYRKL